MLLLAAPARAADRSKLAAEAKALELRFAPAYAQKVSSAHPERDLPLPINFDGDWDATNNWRHLTPSERSRTPAVYGAAVLTKTHAYLTYTLFYPRDWTTPFCVQLICHDNDLESVLLVAERPSVAHPDGKLVLVETKAHNSYPSMLAKDLAFDAAGHPLLRVQSEGHGTYPVPASGHLDETSRVRFVPPGDHAAAGLRSRGYTLLSLHDTLWAHRAANAEDGRLWSAGDTGFLGYRGAREGRRGGVLGDWMAQSEYHGGVRPPWGLQADPGTRGDWFFDPAFVEVARHPKALKGASTDYVYNPYLDELTAECRGKACPAAPPAPHGLSWWWGSLGVAFLGIGLVSSRFRRRSSRSIS